MQLEQLLDHLQRLLSFEHGQPSTITNVLGWLGGGLCGGGGEYRGVLHCRWLGSDQDRRAKLECSRSLAGLEVLNVHWEGDKSFLVGCRG